MRFDPDTQHIIFSASDLKAAAECEFAWARGIDAKLGRVPTVDDPADATLERAARLGDAHEEAILAGYVERLGIQHEGGRGVAVLPKVSSADAAALADAVAQTAAALDSDADVVFQAAFATDEFVGFADFLVRDEPRDGETHGRWRVQDSKLARTARATALMQLAAYVDQLDQRGVARSDEVDLILGDGTLSTHAVRDLLPLFRVRRARLRALIADRSVALGAAGDPLAWGDDRGDLQVSACGRCATCEEQVQEHRDLLLVARMRPVQRQRLRAAGIHTIDALAAAESTPEGMREETFLSLRSQARLQVTAFDVPDAVPPYELVSAQAIGLMPRPSRGDIFFDFEGDPLYTEQADHPSFGLDYLFGWTDNDDAYSALWAHSFAAEKQALLDFLAFVALRRQTHPDLHIYHYAPYETFSFGCDGRQARCRGSRGRHAPAGWRLCRPVPDRLAVCARRVALLLDQEARAAVHGRGGARERCAKGR